MGFKNYLVLQLIILLFLPSISKATQPVRNAYSNVVVNVCQPSDSNSNCGGGGGGGSTTPGGTQGNVQFLDVVGTVKTFQGNNGFQYTGVGSTPGNVGIGTVSPQGLLQISGITNVGINSVAPAQLLDVNGSVKVSGSIYGGDTPTDISPLDVAGLSLQDSKNERYGITVKTTNTTTASVADARIAISDQTGDYVSMNHPATTATVQTLFGKPRSGGDFIFNNSATNNRYLLLGTFGNAPVLFGTNNSEKARFSADGNLGIGNQTPAMKLDVSGSVQMTGFSLTTNPSSGYVLTSNGVGIGTWMPASGGIGSGTITSSTISQVPRFTAATTIAGSTNIWTDNTNVGIGTSAPVYPLDISGTTRIQNAGNWGLGTVNPIGILQVVGIGNVGINSTNPSQLLDVNGTVKAINFIGSSAGLTGLPTGTQWTTNGSNIYFNTGNVGIGTTTSVRTFVVQGTNGNTAEGNTMAITSGLGSGTGTVACQLNITNSVDGATGGGELCYDGSTVATSGVHSANAMVFNNIQAGPIAFATNNNLKMTLSSGGNLGIGSATPGTALDVTGTVRLSGKLTINSPSTTVNCSTSGSIVANQSTTGTGQSTILIYTNNCLGTGTYTFPTAMVSGNAPEVIHLTTSCAASTNSTSTTVTGSGGGCFPGYVLEMGN